MTLGIPEWWPGGRGVGAMVVVGGGGHKMDAGMPASGEAEGQIEREGKINQDRADTVAFK